MVVNEHEHGDQDDAQNIQPSDSLIGNWNEKECTSKKKTKKKNLLQQPKVPYTFNQNFAIFKIKQLSSRFRPKWDIRDFFS